MKPADECRRIRRDLTAFAQGELSPERQVVVEEHLAGCAACRREHEETGTLLSLAPELPLLSATSKFHQRMLEAVRIENEVIRLSTSERLRMAIGYVGFQLRLSRKARILTYAMAAQVALLLTVVFGFNLIIQRTETHGPQMVVDPREAGKTHRDSKDNLIFKHRPTGSASAKERIFDPPTELLSDLAIPHVLAGSGTSEERRIDPGDAYPLDQLNRIVERENRMELSRLHMESRFPWKGKDRARDGRGGDLRTTRAVDRGLAWLAKKQGDDGAWNPRDPSDGDPDAVWGVTALATTAFLSDGHTRSRGRYAETVRKGLDFLLDGMDAEGRIGFKGDDARMSLFNQGTAVFALAENYILCEGEDQQDLLPALDSLSRQLLDREIASETPTRDALCEAWAAMALNTAMMTGLESPHLKEAMNLATDRVGRKARLEGWAFLLPPSMRAMPPLYAASGLAMNALFHDLNPSVDASWFPLPDQDALERLFSLLDTPAFREPSFLFFFGTALCEQEDPLWKDWNRRIKIDLIREQEKEGGWSADTVSPWIDGGDIYFTALHLLTLQIYYRFSNR